LVDVDLTAWSPLQMAIGGFETTTMAEVTPRWVTERPLYIGAAARVVSGDAEIQRPGRTPFSWSSSVNAKVASTIEMQITWFPGWQVRVDGQPALADPDLPSGLITFQVPTGTHVVDVEYGRTTLEHASCGISIAAVVLAAALAMASLPRRKVLSQRAADTSPRPLPHT
jgi:hypothetical protein